MKSCLKSSYNLFRHPSCISIYRGILLCIFIILQSYITRSILCKDVSSGICSNDPAYIILTFFLSGLLYIFVFIFLFLVFGSLYWIIFKFYVCFYNWLFTEEIQNGEYRNLVI